MNNVGIREFTIATPTGQRVLMSIEPGNFALVRRGFEPHASNPSQCLRLHDLNSYPMTVSADGTWINPRQLYAIASGVTKRANAPVSADYIRDILFFDYWRPDVGAAFRKVFASCDDGDRWWIEMHRHTWFDPDTATLHPIITA
jgi:hypothetical protein